MRSERLYHSAPSAAENSPDVSQGMNSFAGSSAPLANAFPRGLEAAAYALRKRVVCPRWWLVGVMSQWLSKDSQLWALELALDEDDWLLSGPAMTPKNFPLVVLLWTELYTQVSRAEPEGNFTVELNLNRILRGTAAEIHSQKDFLTGYLSSALRVQRVKGASARTGSRRSKGNATATHGLMLEQVGLVQIVENVVLKQGVADVLLVTFARDPRRLFTHGAEELLPSALRNNASGSLLGIRAAELLGKSLVTLQPDVLQAMSRTVNPKKLCAYLSLEIMKQDSAGERSDSGEDIWRGRALGHSELAKLHKEQLARAQSFYDHGILSWENEAPRQRVRNLVKRSSQFADSGIVHCWRMSQHAMEAIQFEEALSGILNKAASRSLSLEFESGKCTLLPEQSVSAGSAVFFKSQQAAQMPESNSEHYAVLPVQKLEAEFNREFSDTRPQTASVGLELKKTVSEVLSTSVVTAASVNSGFARSERLVASFDEVHVPPDLVVPKTSSRTIAGSAAREPAVKRDVLNDDDFLMCVAEFYESLTPVQQQAFERDRKRMTPEQFKRYVTPALMRHRGRT